MQKKYVIRHTYGGVYKTVQHAMKDMQMYKYMFLIKYDVRQFDDFHMKYTKNERMLLDILHKA